tara:strand:- start:744 stop:1286 length:543 start_codon:yes stop_codon:yes gene_type:complete
MGRRRRRRRRGRSPQQQILTLPQPVQRSLRRGRPQPQPRFYEDYDINNDKTLDVSDIVAWGGKGRRDVQQRLANMIGSGNLPRKRPVSRPKPRMVYGVPRQRWVKLNPRQRRAQVSRFRRSARARAQSIRRTNRMVRGARKVYGGTVTRSEVGRLGRTQRRQHAMLERRRRKFRIRKLGR